MHISSLKNKISIGAGLCALVTALIIIGYSVLLIRGNTLEAADKESTAIARAMAADIQSIFNREVESVQILAQSMSALKSDVDRPAAERQKVIDILRVVLKKNPFVADIFTCWEPDAFDGLDQNHAGLEFHDATGRFAVYLARDNEGELFGRSLLGMADRSPKGMPGDWYQFTKTKGQLFISEPYKQNINERQEHVITISAPISANGEFYGVVGIDLNLNVIQRNINNSAVGARSKTIVISPSGMLAGVTGNPELTGKHMEVIHPDYREDMEYIRKGEHVTARMDDNIEIYAPVYLSPDTDPWSANILIPLDSFTAISNMAMIKMILIGIFCIVLALLLIRYIAGEALGQLNQVVNVASGLAEGDLSRRLDMDRDDEVGILAASLDHSCNSLSVIIREITTNSEMQASSSQQMSSVSSQLATTSEEMSSQSESVAGATEQMSASINSMASAAEEMSVNIQSVSSTAEQMSQNMNSIASSIEQMSTSIEDVALNARDGSIIAKQAMEMSGSATSTMEMLGKAAKEIGEVTNLIKRIADQTNLLALNATIEAASAGEAGKGFAVVANEIKELANQSGQAANEIANRVKGVQRNTGSAVEAIGGITDIIQRMNESSALISGSVEEQTSTSIEISDSVQQATAGVGNIATSIAELARGANDVSKSASEAARGVNEISSNIQGLSLAARESNSGASQVNSTAAELARMAAQLRDLAARFKI